MTIDQKALIEAIERLRALDARAGSPIVATDLDRGLTVAQAMALRRAERDAALHRASSSEPVRWAWLQALVRTAGIYFSRAITLARRWR